MRSKRLSGVIIAAVVAVGLSLFLLSPAASAMQVLIWPFMHSPQQMGPAPSSSPSTWGWGMMGGMMGGYADCPYHGWGWQGEGGERITMDEARQILEGYVATAGGGLEIREIMEFQYNFYAMVAETDTGIGAFELLVNPYTGSIAPEPGPNMMWNTKYGMMSQGLVTPTAEMPVTPGEAEEIALDYLARSFSGEVEVEEPMRFYGYYTLDFEVDGEVYGMLSVNGYTGQVWYHSWHGQFIQELEMT